MPRNYDEEPLREAVCEFRFNSTIPWDWTLPGLVYEKFRKDFPLKRQTSLLELGESVPDVVASQFESAATRVQFSSSDELRLLQMAPNTFSVHHRSPYPGWAKFLKLALESLSTYLEVVPAGAFVRLGLRYINRIALPAGQADLAEYFTLAPHLPQGVAGQLSSFVLQLQNDVAEGDELRIVFGTVVPEEHEESAYILDLDFYSTLEREPSTEIAENWLNHAHELLENSFDASFTNRTHVEVFKEVRA
jgi:uncharacterized protein (TIGR04255 family)